MTLCFQGKNVLLNDTLNTFYLRLYSRKDNNNDDDDANDDHHLNNMNKLKKIKKKKINY